MSRGNRAISFEMVKPWVTQVHIAMKRATTIDITAPSMQDTAVPAEGNGDLQTLICVLVARPRRCLTLSSPVP